VPEREVRYCTSEDGVRIAYSVEGEGPTLVVVSDFLESLGFSHLVPELDRFLARLGEGRRLVMFDRRGMGLSQRDATNSFEADIADLRTVIQAAHLEEYSLFAAGVAGPKSIAYAASNPPAFKRLVLYGTMARAPSTSSMGDGAQGLFELMQTNWLLASQVIADFTQRERAGESNIALTRMYRETSSGEQATDWILKSWRHSDARGRLTSVQVPTLIMHRINDPLWPLEGAQQMAAEIRDSRLLILEGSFHPAQIDSDPIVEGLNAFLDEDPATRRVALGRDISENHGAFRTVLFTDLVGHTEMMSRLGDEAGRAVLREHETITREVLKQHGGTEIKTMGDGFMASFGSVTRAVECAIALQRAFDQRNEAGPARPEPRPAHPEVSKDDDYGHPEPLHVRVGLNAGEPIEEDGDLFGATVILASRIAAKADAGEILVADTVRGLCSGKGFSFADRGDFEAKGFEDPVRIYEVRWRS
jgi:class 3 adenylate cyclase